MKIIVAGGGKVGLALIRQLSAEDNDITIIDSKQSVLDEIVERYDVIAVQGNCAAMSVLSQADVENADILIATIEADEVNLLCCMTAHKMNSKLHTIARIRNPEYREQIYRMRDSFGLSLQVNPERQAALEIERLIRYPGFLHRDSFAKDRVEIVELSVDENHPLKGKTLSSINSVIGVKVLICAILRNGTAVIPNGGYYIEEGDRLFVTAPTSNLALLLKNLGIVTHRVKNVMICGGGRITHYLAQRLEKSGINLTIVEKEYDKCLNLVENFPKANIIHGDATDIKFMEREGLNKCDTLVSMTGLDEMNMVISLYGHNSGVNQVITKLAHIDRSPMLEGLKLGSVINPKELCSNIIVRYVRALKNKSESTLSIHSIADGQVEALEFSIDDTVKNCGIPLKNLRLKKETLIVCISKGAKQYIPDGDTYYEQGDIVIVVTGQKNIIGKFNDIFDE